MSYETLENKVEYAMSIFGAEASAEVLTRGIWQAFYPQLVRDLTEGDFDPIRLLDVVRLPNVTQVTAARRRIRQPRQAKRAHEPPWWNRERADIEA